MNRAESSTPGPSLADALRPIARTLRRSLHVARGTIADHAHAALNRGALDPVLRRPIVLDSCVFQEEHGGISRVWRSVMAEWSASGFAERVLVVDRAGVAPRHAGFAYIPAPPMCAHDISAERAMLESICVRASADLFVSTLYSYPAATPSLLVVHDLTPEVLGWDISTPMWRDKAAAIGRASAFACISRSTSRDLHRLYPASADKPTSITPLAVSPDFAPSPATDVDSLRRELHLPSTYYVFVGYRDIHKNAELVFDALAAMGTPSDVGLLLVGGGRELEPRFRERAGDSQVRVARLSDEQLRAAYSGAAALLYPSRHEGFGLVVLEAMACGCPVVTCRNSALPEAADDAAVYVGEDAGPEMARAMRDVLDEATRADLIARGLAWSARFRWSETARALAVAVTDAAGLTGSAR